jgi:uncharacterized protein (TIGR00297 family)
MNNAARKIIHILMGGFLFALPHLTLWQAAALALAAFLFNVFVFPKLLPNLLREKTDRGILIYPLSVLALILLFPTHEIHAAMGWAAMAFGDGFASLIGKSLPLKKLPWNPDKSWGGLLSFILFGTASGWVVTGVFLGHSAPAPVLLAIFGAAAVVETLPLPVIDNVTVPLTAAFLSALLLPMTAFRFPLPAQAGVAFVSTLCIGTAAYLLNLVSRSGWVGGVLVGTLIFAFASWQGFAALAYFFVLASLFTFLGYKRKQALGIAQEGGGRRGAVHALANCLWGVLLALLLPSHPDTVLVRVMFASVFATALSDTTGSEIGKAFGRVTFLPWNLKRVPKGTDGAVSVEGLLASLPAPYSLGALLAAFGWLTWPAAAVVGTAGFLGNLSESYLARAGEWNNELLNFTNTVIGSGLGMMLWSLAR